MHLALGRRDFRTGVRLPQHELLMRAGEKVYRRQKIVPRAAGQSFRPSHAGQSKPFSQRKIIR